MTQAATVKQQVAERFGTSVDIHGGQEPAFPDPRRLVEVTDQLDDVGQVKKERLAHLTDATLIRSWYEERQPSRFA